MILHLFHHSAGASGDMIMASLLNLGADLHAVRQAVESVGCRLEVSRQKRNGTMTRRAAVTSDKSFQSSRRCATRKALENALSALHILAGAEGRVHGLATEQAHFHEVGALNALADISSPCAAHRSLEAKRAYAPARICEGLRATYEIVARAQDVVTDK